MHNRAPDRATYGSYEVQPFDMGWAITERGGPAEEYHYYFRTREEAIEFAEELARMERRRMGGRHSSGRRAAAARRWTEKA